jgi:hypothetical protein
MGFTWGAVWSGAAAAVRWVVGVETDAPLPLLFGLLGFIAGATFSGLLTLAEGRRRFDQISLPRFAWWGAIGGLLLSAVISRATALGWGEALALAPALAIACGGSAAGSLALARRAERRELPDNRGDATDRELTRHEKRKLLGGGD